MNLRSHKARHPRPAGGPSEVTLRDSLQGGLDAVEVLPALPEVIAQILSLVEDPSVSAQRVAKVVGSDQSLVSSILRQVNSPFYALRGTIVSIQHAVVLLGLRTIRNMALSSVLVRAFSTPARDNRFNRSLLWRHTVACAAGARWLALAQKRIDPEEAFLAGLLHDMGLLVCDQYFHPDFLKVLDAVLHQSRGLLEAEREVYGMDHGGVGAILARRWNFPSAVCDAISCHHDPTAATHAPSLAALVHLAHHLPESNEEERVPQIWDGLPMDPAAVEQAGLTPEVFTARSAGFREEWERAESLVRLG